MNQIAGGGEPDVGLCLPSLIVNAFLIDAFNNSADARMGQSRMSLTVGSSSFRQCHRRCGIDVAAAGFSWSLSSAVTEGGGFPFPSDKDLLDKKRPNDYTDRSNTPRPETLMPKSTVEEIRHRFDNEVERFSNLETGQSATMDAPLCLELIAQAAAAVTPDARDVLDIGCGAGNYTLKLLERLPGLQCTLMDLSQPMLDRAQSRVKAVTGNQVTVIQSDIRAADLRQGQFDVLLAAAVLHHMRDEAEWRAVFHKLYSSLRPGGSLWIFDLVIHEPSVVQDLMWQRYGRYLTELNGEAYRNAVFEYIEREDTPRSLPFQLDLLRETGFGETVVLHKNGPFAAFGAVRTRQ